jgi:hypothetical protein
VLVTPVAAPAAIVNTPSALVSSNNTLVEGRDRVETNTVAADEVECTILPSFIVLTGFLCRVGRSYIGD